MGEDNNSGRRHRDGESSKGYRHHRKQDDDRRRSDDHHHRHREGSKDRDTHHERERSRSVERKRRKERDWSEERSPSVERTRRRQQREESEEPPSVERSKRKNRGDSEERSEKRARVFEENGKERRRFEDEHQRDDTSSSAGNGFAVEPISTSRTTAETSVIHGHAPPTKVSSISKTNENKGVNINRSHEVPGSSSTDGSAPDIGKSTGLSLDVLAKARKALQKQKELAERMKKITSANKDAAPTREGSPGVSKKEAANVILSTKSTMSMPVSQGTPAAISSTSAGMSSVVPPQSGLPHLPGLTAQNCVAVKRAQELAVKMGFRQDPEFAPLLNMFPGQHVDVAMQTKPSKAPVLRLDALGREIDEHGNLVNVPKVNTLSTLKVNINKQKKDAFQILKPELEVDPEKNPFYDPGMGIDKNKLLRPKRMNFQFVEEGKWSKDAEIIKLKAQFGEAKAKELKTKQAQLAKAKAEPDINPNLIEVGERITTKDKPKVEPIPDVEWWDVPFLQSGSYGDIIDGAVNEDVLKLDKITIYVEHPRPIEPPSEPAPPPPQPLKLTKKEQKKLRTQRRLAREKDRQEMIRLGVLEPPKAKVKMSNLMKVLGTEATQDPTKLEMEIRSAAAEREQAHIDRNTARKLTPAERREKKERKLFDDSNTIETMVSVYKVNDLSHPQARFKVDINAQENRLSGCAVISEGTSVVVVEGGAKSIKRYGKLMLKRIDWTAVVKKEEDAESEDDDEDKPVNKCLLVWQGSVAKPNFNRFFVQECRTEAAARKYLSDHGVCHYWDLAVNFTEDNM